MPKTRWQHADLAEAHLKVAEELNIRAFELENKKIGEGRTSSEALRLRIREEHALLRAQVHATLANAEVLG